ncbi:MAG: hypothetical protein HEQ13_06815 [Dolichospermum sp. DEX189]|jgi:hypothetical protein|nr:hypothetical protein [Dolichospermum sp. DEX189]
MHLNEIQLSNRKACRGEGSAPWIILHPKDNRYSKALEMIADYKANRNGNYVKKFPLTVQDADTLPTVVKE